MLPSQLHVSARLLIQAGLLDHFKEFLETDLIHTLFSKNILKELALSAAPLLVSEGALHLATAKSTGNNPT